MNRVGALCIAGEIATYLIDRGNKSARLKFSKSTGYGGKIYSSNDANLSLELEEGVRPPPDKGGRNAQV